MAGRLWFGGLLSSTESQLSSEELCLTCAIISTADYCVETTEQVSHHHYGNHTTANNLCNIQLESKMKEEIDEEFSSKVDFSQEKDLFHRCLFSFSVKYFTLLITLAPYPVGCSYL